MHQFPDSIGASAPLDLLAPSAQAELRARRHSVDRTAGVLAASAYLATAEERSSDRAILGVILSVVAFPLALYALEGALRVGGSL